MKQSDIHEEIQRTLRGLAEKVVETLDGRDKINGKASLTTLKIYEALDAFDPKKMEQMSDETAVEVLEYLTMVYSGILVFLQQHNLEA